MEPEITPKPEKKVRIVKPDPAKHKEAIANIDAQLDTYRKKQDAINAKINSVRGKGSSSEQRMKLIERLKEIREEQAEIKKSKKPIFDRQEECRTAISKLSEEIKALQTKQRFTKISDINNQINDYEAQIEKGSLRLIDEKKLLNEISNLRRGIKAVEAIDTLQKQIDEYKAEMDKISQKLSGTNSSALSTEYNELQEKLDLIKAKHSDERAEIDTLYSERNSFKEQIDKLYDEKRLATAEFRTKTNEFYEYQQEERKRRAENERNQRVKDARDRMLSIAQEQRELASVPAFQDEISNCNNLVFYLQSTFSIKDASVDSSSEVKSSSAQPEAVNTRIREPDTSANVPEGFKLIPKKESRNDEYFSGKSAAQKKKKNTKKTTASNLSSSQGSSKSGVKLPLTMIERFSQLGISPPARIDQITDAINKINELKEAFIKDQDRVTAENSAKAEARVAQLISEFSATEIE
ncbi:hypothetical protein AYI68_g4971 [Smittium mucronatum]|uniref:Nuclear segregation protein BFR1 n=1 Tax=Smittium mucronatum TaxID=133383 RepID=A0A1R0GVN1_9FUNG|nr:hypothetical protein AYI68_g4971 [Smittium mucronatum]